MNHLKVYVGLVIVLMLLVVGGCTNPITPSSTENAAVEKRVTDQDTLLNGVRHESGVLGPGALYKLWVPPAALWQATGNSLVLYVHGYVTTAQQVALPTDLGAFRDSLLLKGFAIAYSSFSENGWAVKDGVIRTRQLLGYVKGKYGKPGKTFLVGASEGGIISLMLTEKNHNLFDGTLSICSLLGGAQMEMDYMLNVRVLFDYFFRGQLRQLALPGSVAEKLDAALGDRALAATGEGSGLPADGNGFALYVAPTLIFLLMNSPPEWIFAMATMTVDEKPLFNWPPAMFVQPSFISELAVTIAAALWYNIYGTADLLGRTHDHVMVDNMDSKYASPLMLRPQIAVLNTAIERLSARPDALKYLEHWYQPSGKLRIPVVTLHTTRDPIVSIHHEYAFRDLVGSVRSEYLAQFVSPGFGHCELLEYVGHPLYFRENPVFALQVEAAFNYLVAWSASGQKPNPALFPVLSPLP
jgi:hypothetical protein